MATLDKIALALSDPTRLQILDHLVAGRDEVCCSPTNPETPQGVCSCDLLPKLDIAPSRLSYHMKELREAGLVHEQKKGRWIYYTLDRSALAAFLAAVGQRYLGLAAGAGVAVNEAGAASEAGATTPSSAAGEAGAAGATCCAGGELPVINARC
jgi:ArsR family transcriptional regulator